MAGRETGLGRVVWAVLLLGVAGVATGAEPEFAGAAWIWRTPEPGREAGGFPTGACRFRAVLEVPATAQVESAELLVTADNLYRFYLNGRAAGEGHADPNAWNQPKRFAVTGLLQPGRNLLAIEATNTAPGPAGLLARLVVRLAGGAVVDLPSSATWRCADTAPAGWTTPGFDDTAWTAAHVVAEYGAGPWGRLTVAAGAEPVAAPPAAATTTAPPPTADFSGATWIWFPAVGRTALESFLGGTYGFRLTFVLPDREPVRAAEILLTADNQFTLYANGQVSAESETWSQPKRIDLTARLLPGRNVLAIEATNTVMGPAGLVAKLIVRAGDGPPRVWVTDDTWRCSEVDADGWEARDLDDSAWPAARVLGEMGMAPWGAIAAIPAAAERARTDLSTAPGPDFRWPGAIAFLGDDCSLYPDTAAGPGAASLSVTVFTARHSRAYPEHDLPAPVKVARKLFVLEPGAANPAPRLLLDAGSGAIGSPSVSFDGRWIYLSMARQGDPFFHLYRIAGSDSEVTQLTDGPFHDIDPAELPDGRIAFTSTRIGTFEEYHNPPSRALFTMDADGRNLYPLTHTFVFDNEPEVLADGRLLFIRSDNFFDRGKVETLLHAIHPDGTAGYTEFGLDLGPEYGGRLRAFYCGSPAPMPDGRVAFVSAAGVVIGRPGSRAQQHLGLDVGDVAALPDGRLLCTLSKRRAYQRIGVLDPDASPARLTVVYDSKGLSLHSPVSLGPRPRPPRLASRVEPLQAEAPAATGVLYCQNARFTRNSTAGWSHVRAIRVLGGKGLTVRSSHSYIVHAGSEVMDLGTVPLAPDGSFAVEVPADLAIAFQAVDAEGRSELNEMSWIYVRPGEARGCIGCHSPRQAAPPGAAGRPLAMRTRPLRLLGRGQPLRFRGNNPAVTGLMELQLDRFREVAGIDRHGGTANPLATGAQEVAALISQLTAGDEFERTAAAQRLAVFRDRAAAPALAERLRDRTPEVRVAAALALGACGTRDSVPPLVDSLTDPEPLAAQAAALALAHLTGVDDGFNAFQHSEGREAQARAWRDRVQATPWDAVERDLVARLAGPDRNVVRRAAATLGHVGQAAARTALREYVARERDRNPYPEWRQSHAGDGAQFNAASPANPRTLQAATRALGWLQDRDAVDLLAETLARHAVPATGNLFLAEAAAEALGRIGTPAATAALADVFGRLRDYPEFTSWYGDHGALMACHASPVHAAILEALDAQGTTVDPALVAHLIRSLPTDTDRALLLENDDYETLTGRVIRRCGAEKTVVEACLAVLGDGQAARTPAVTEALAATHGAWGGRPDPENRAAHVLSLVCRDRAWEPRIRAAFERYRRTSTDIPRVFSDGIPVVARLPVRHWVCFFLARALGNLADPGSAAPLAAALAESPAEGAAGRPDPTGPGVLFLHNDLTPCWRAAVAWALGRTADRGVLPLLLATAGDPANAPDTRHAAAVAAGRLAAPADAAALGALAAQCPEVSTRKALLAACDRLQP